MILIILAAGRGARIRKFTRKPKCLIEINKKTIIQSLIENINLNFKKIIFVIGYRKNFLKKKIKNLFQDRNILFVENDVFKKTNNSYSIYLTKRYINDDVIFVNADLYLSNKLFDLKKIKIKKNIKNFVLIDKNKINFKNADLTKIRLRGKKISKLLKSKKSNKIDAIAPGVYGLSKNQIHQHIKITEKKIRQGKLNEGFIEPINELIKKGLQLNTLNITRHVSWVNVNSKRDLNSIKNKKK